jgi:transposase
MSLSRKKYNDEFKKQAVRMSYAAGRSVAEVAASLGIHPNMLFNWRKKYTPTGEKTQLSEELDENRRLRMRISELEEENDLLKKASAYFAKHLK